ncbi:PAS domain S-box-containing protein [Methanolinea mesophila]|uniref:PAS domain S-box protein n=1 Tax=Methanolinea mesophila TaxID=547055 RepID=UPI001AE53810|nr:PAS domain S-box protein [Methanolinea mesophila]MBP1928683.1 PAS domain S-box-containing protein [Methanolinea mesophila]
MIRECGEVLKELEAASRDLGEREQQLESHYHALTGESRRFWALFSETPLGYLVTDREGAIEEANPASEELLGMTSPELRGTLVFRYIPPAREQALRKALNKSVTRKKRERLETELVKKRGDHRPVEITIVPASVDDSGTELHWTIRDVSLERRAEEETRERALLEELFAGISRRFISRTSGDTGEIFDEALRELGTYAGVDRCVLLILDPGDVTITGVSEWCREDTSRIADFLLGTSLESFPWLLPQIRLGEVIEVPRMEKLPPGASAEQRYWKNLKVQMALVIPLLVNEEPAGALFLEHTRKKKRWAAARVEMIQTAGSLFANMVARLRDEEALRVSEEQYRTLFENFLNPVFIAGDDGRFTDANVAAMDFMERSVEDIREHSLEDWLPGIKAMMPPAPERQIVPRTIETEYTVNGKTKTLLMNVVPFPIRGRTLLYGLGQDITARKMAEKEVEDARVFVEGIIHAASPSMVVVTSDMRVAFANRSFYDAFGLSSEAVLHRVFFDIGKADFGAGGLRDKIAEVFRGGTPLVNFEFQHMNTRGELKVLNISASLIRRSAPFAPMVVIVITDITERKKMEEALERSRELYRYIASFTQENPSPILEVREDGSVAFSNVAAGLALRRRGFENPERFFPMDMPWILAELKQGNNGFFFREVQLGETYFGETIYLSPEQKTVRIYAQDLTAQRKKRTGEGDR